MATIKISKGYKVSVDKKYLEILSKNKWKANVSKNTVYAEHTKLGSMHRKIMELEGYDIKGKEVDHKDQNGLNNFISNLRICSHKQNIRNQNKHKNNTSGYKGVSWKKDKNKWTAQIRIDNNKRIFLGYFSNKIDAAKAYNNAAIKYHGEFAKLNEIK